MGPKVSFSMRTFFVLTAGLLLRRVARNLALHPRPQNPPEDERPAVNYLCQSRPSSSSIASKGSARTRCVPSCTPSSDQAPSS